MTASSTYTHTWSHSQQAIDGAVLVANSPLGGNMRSIIEYSALAVAGWLSFDVLFVIAWARFHSARRHSEEQLKATVIVFRPNRLTGDPSELALKKTS